MIDYTAWGIGSKCNELLLRMRNEKVMYMIQGLLIPEKPLWKLEEL